MVNLKVGNKNYFYIITGFLSSSKTRGEGEGGKLKAGRTECSIGF